MTPDPTILDGGRIVLYNAIRQRLCADEPVAASLARFLSPYKEHRIEIASRPKIVVHIEDTSLCRPWQVRMGGTYTQWPDSCGQLGKDYTTSAVRTRHTSRGDLCHACDYGPGGTPTQDSPGGCLFGCRSSDEQFRQGVVVGQLSPPSLRDAHSGPHSRPMPLSRERHTREKWSCPAGNSDIPARCVFVCLS